MQRASDLFSADDRARINQAVAAAEERTAAEIVPAVATASGRYDRPEDMLGLWTALIAMSVVWFLLPAESPEPGSWGGWPSELKLAVLLITVLAGFIVGAGVLSRIDVLRSLFTPVQQKQEEVFARARQVFFDGRVHHTSGGSGLLIYVSLFERMAAIVADRGILEKLGQPALDELCQELTAKLKSGHPANAFCDVIRQAGERLGAMLPRSGETNQLPDALVVLD